MCNCVLTEDGTGRMIAGGRGGPAQPTHKLKGGGGTSPEKAPSTLDGPPVRWRMVAGSN